jgi:biotin-(acetyl-CoA carboxylase) ligase
MTDKFDEQIPGVTLWMKNAQAAEDGHRKGVRAVEITLYGEINDEKLYEDVLKKLQEGLRIFTADGFESSIMGLMRERISELETELTVTQRNLRQAEDDKTRAETELKKYKEPFASLGQALGYRGGSGPV